MNKVKNIFLGLAAAGVMAGCSDDLPLADVVDNTTHGIALRSLVETNGLDISDMSSTYTHQFEIDAVSDGEQPETIRVLVGFTDQDADSDDPANSVDPSLFATLSPSDFNETTDLNTHNLPVGTFSASLSELISHLGLADGDYVRGDEIDFEFEVISTNGVVFGSSNVGTNVAAAGRFSFYNSPFAFAAAIDDPNRIVLDNIGGSDFTSGRLRTGVADTVFLEFDEATFSTAPTINRTSAGGFTDDSIGSLVQVTDEDGANVDGSYYFLYTAGAAATDTVSFTVSGAESVPTFTMVSKTASDLFIIDNVRPTASLLGASAEMNDAATGVKEIVVSVLFDAEIEGDVTYTITQTDAGAAWSVDPVTQDAEGEEEATIAFRPALTAGGGQIPAGTTVSFTVTVSGTDLTNTTAGEGTDGAGNAVSSVIAVSIF